ncbi:MAG: DUF5916 domain-containing protein [Acidobacteriota bacterium]
MKRCLLMTILLFGFCLIEANAVQDNNPSTKNEPATSAPAKADEKSLRPTGAKAVLNLPIEKINPVRIPKFEQAPAIDGKLDEAIWQQAAVFKDFYQTHPGDNLAPSRDTKFMMGYDSKNIYIAVYAYDEPDKIRATVAQRDGILNEDNLRIFLDTFNDQRRAYVIGFNPYGIQADGILTEGAGTDFNVDIVMESKGQIVADGWTVEARIPFKSLRYTAGKGKAWGFNVWRNIDRFNDEIDSWMPLSRDKVGQLNQAGRITGFEEIATERTFEIIPSITLVSDGRRVPTLPFSAILNNPTLTDPGRLVNSPVNSDIGLTMKFSITPNITLDAAINPDFAQVEADAPVVTANQRFPIFFAEKRPFFLEGIDIFSTPIRAVHTRAIVDPDYAFKISGKEGRTSFGLLLASDNAPGNYSDEERNDPDILPTISRFLDKNAYIAVARLKRDIGRESNLGFLATSYDFIEKHNKLAGFDGRFRLDKQTTFSFQALGATSRNFFRDIENDTNVYRTGNGLGYQFNFNHSERHFGYNLNGSGRTRDYRADVGFVFRTDTHTNGVNWSYRSDPDPKARLVSWSLFNNATISYDGQGRSQSADSSVDLSLAFTKQNYIEVSYVKFYSRLFEEEFGAKRSVTREGAFLGAPERSTSGNGLFFNYYTSPSQKYTATFSFNRIWNDFDFDFGAGARYPRVSPAALLDPNATLDPGAANGWSSEVSFNYKPTAALEVEFEYSRSSLKRNDTSHTVYVSNIYTTFAKYQFTRYLYARAIVDYSTLESQVRGQYLFGWTPNPGTAFYFGYNDAMNYNGFSPFTGHLERGFRLQNRTFFIKASYLFRKSI